MRFHFHKFMPAAIFENVRLRGEHGQPAKPERYVAAVGSECVKCGKRKLDFFDLLGRPAKKAHANTTVVSSKNWLLGAKLDNLLVFGPVVGEEADSAEVNKAQKETVAAEGFEPPTSTL